MNNAGAGLSQSHPQAVGVFDGRDRVPESLWTVEASGTAGTGRGGTSETWATEREGSVSVTKQAATGLDNTECNITTIGLDIKHKMHV